LGLAVADILVVDELVYRAVENVHLHLVEGPMSVEGPTHEIDIGYATTGARLATLSLSSSFEVQRSTALRFTLTDWSLAKTAPLSNVHSLVRNLEVHRPDLIPFSGRDDFSARLSDRWVRSTEKSVGSMSSIQIEAWLDVRDAVDRYFAIPENGYDLVDRVRGLPRDWLSHVASEKFAAELEFLAIYEQNTRP